MRDARQPQRSNGKKLSISALGWAGIALLLVLAAGSARAAAGPDVTVFTLSGVGNYGSSSGESGYSIGTTSCNQGTAPLNWCDNFGGCGNGTTSADHPVIAQNIYKLSNGRFEQLGLSWLKHGFVSTNSPASGCGTGCVSPPLGGNQLGVGCTDPYGSSLNGSRPLGLRSEVNATTGVYPHPETAISFSTVVDQRIRVKESELTLGNGERYFGEAQYIAPDDAQAGNGLNNASYREIALTLPGFGLQFTGSTVRELPALYVWRVIDPTVEIAEVDILRSTPLERFQVARKVTDLGGGTWHYEYAVRNHNSHRAARSFRAVFSGATTISNAGARMVSHHSGEPYSTNPWTLDSSVPDEIRWSTDDFATNANANALRWSTQFNFWFDATRGPDHLTHWLGLFRPGMPMEVEFLNGLGVFADGFETGDVSAWSASVL